MVGFVNSHCLSTLAFIIQVFQDWYVFFVHFFCFSFIFYISLPQTQVFSIPPPPFLLISSRGRKEFASTKKNVKRGKQKRKNVTFLKATAGFCNISDQSLNLHPPDLTIVFLFLFLVKMYLLQVWRKKKNTQKGQVSAAALKGHEVRVESSKFILSRSLLPKDHRVAKGQGCPSGGHPLCWAPPTGWMCSLEYPKETRLAGHYHRHHCSTVPALWSLRKGLGLALPVQPDGSVPLPMAASLLQEQKELVAELVQDNGSPLHPLQIPPGWSCYPGRTYNDEGMKNKNSQWE